MKQRRAAIRSGIALACAIASIVSAGPAAAIEVCPVDCAGDGEVTVDELLRAVGVAVGEGAVAGCSAADRDCDQQVTVDELIRGTVAALEGCPRRARGTLRVAASAAEGIRSQTPRLITGGTPYMPAQFVVREPAEVAVSDFVTGLDTPWGMAFAPDGRLFLTERSGRVRVVVNGILDPQPWATLPAREIGEGGLMGIAIAPDFADEPFVYVCYTADEGSELGNRVVRVRERGGRGDERETVLDGIAGNTFHNGCRLKFGPDGLLYITTGDAQDRERAQDLATLDGKVLRIHRDGTAPEDNPFPDAPLVWSYGHRNPQGLAFDRVTGRLYETEHGPSFEVGVGAFDEVNIVEAGRNYGWPRVVGAPLLAEYADPLLTFPAPSGPVPPAGAALYRGSAIPDWNGDLLFASLGAKHLQRVGLDQCGRAVAIERLFQDRFGRLRDVVEGPDGAIYVATSNRDGRGDPVPEDDRILRLTGAGDGNRVP